MNKAIFIRWQPYCEWASLPLLKGLFDFFAATVCHVVVEAIQRFEQLRLELRFRLDKVAMAIVSEGDN